MLRSLVGAILSGFCLHVGSALGGDAVEAIRDNVKKKKNEKRETAMRILGLREGFSLAELKIAYKKAANESHPDKGGTPKEFSMVNQAYEYLKGTL